MLHESIPDRGNKIKTGKRVTSIKVNDTGVEVTCDDGTIEQGSIVMGCDGIRSIARTEMDRLERAETGRATNKTPLHSMGSSGGHRGTIGNFCTWRRYHADLLQPSLRSKADVLQVAA